MVECSEDIKLICSKTYFQGIRKLKLNMDADSYHIRDLRATIQPGAIDYTKEKVSASSGCDRIQSGIEKIIEAEEAYEDELQRFGEELSVARKVADKIEDVTTRNIIRFYYFDGLNMKRIAGLVGYSKRQAYRFRDMGLIEAYDYIPSEYKSNIPKAL